MKAPQIGIYGLQAVKILGVQGRGRFGFRVQGSGYQGIRVRFQGLGAPRLERVGPSSRSAKNQIGIKRLHPVKILGFRVGVALGLGFRVQAIRVLGLGFRVQGPQGFRVQVLGFRFQRLGFRVQVLGLAPPTCQDFRVQGRGVSGLGFRVQGIRVLGLGFRVQGFRFQGLGSRVQVQGLRDQVSLGDLRFRKKSGRLFLVSPRLQSS